jgi:hypothetical protein
MNRTKFKTGLTLLLCLALTLCPPLLGSAADRAEVLEPELLTPAPRSPEEEARISGYLNANARTITPGESFGYNGKTYIGTVNGLIPWDFSSGDDPSSVIYDESIEALSVDEVLSALPVLDPDATPVRLEGAAAPVPRSPEEEAHVNAYLEANAWTITPGESFTDIDGKTYLGVKNGMIPWDFSSGDAPSDLISNGSPDAISSEFAPKAAYRPGGDNPPTTATTLPYSPTPTGTIYDYTYTNYSFHPRAASPTSITTTFWGTISSGSMVTWVRLVDWSTGLYVHTEPYNSLGSSTYTPTSYVWSGLDIIHFYYYRIQVFTQTVPGSSLTFYLSIT